MSYSRLHVKMILDSQHFMTKYQGLAPKKKKKSTSLKKGYYKNNFHIKNKLGALLETKAIF